MWVFLFNSSFHEGNPGFNLHLSFSYSVLAGPNLWSMILPTYQTGRYPRLPKEIPSETVGEGSGYLSGGPVGEILDMGYMGVSENNATPKSSILIGISIINHPFWGSNPSIFGLTPI